MACPVFHSMYVCACVVCRTKTRQVKSVRDAFAISTRDILGGLVSLFMSFYSYLITVRAPRGFLILRFLEAWRSESACDVAIKCASLSVPNIIAGVEARA